MSDPDLRCLRERRPGVWEVRVHVGREPHSGRVRQISRVSRGTLEEAQALRSRLEADVADGVYGGSNATLSELLDEWDKDRVSRGCAPRTLDGSRSRMKVHIRPALGDVKLQTLSPDLIAAFYRDRRAADVGESTMVAIHRDLMGALRDGQRWGWVASDLVSRVRAPKKPANRQTSVPEAADVQQLIAAAATSGVPQMASLIAVAALSGMRQGELCALRFSAVDLEEGTVDVRHSIWEAGTVRDDTYRWGLKAPKSGKPRAFMMPESALDVIRRRYLLLVLAADTMGVKAPSDAFIWSRDPLGQTPIMPRTVMSLFGKLKTREGIDCRFHDLRAFTGAEMIAAGVNPRIVADRLGDKDPSITLRLYNKGRRQADRDAANALGLALGPLPAVTT